MGQEIDYIVVERWRNGESEKGGVVGMVESEGSYLKLIGWKGGEMIVTTLFFWLHVCTHQLITSTLISLPTFILFFSQYFLHGKDKDQ